jgi:hypothetical protein
MGTESGDETARCGYFTESMDHPCQQRVGEPGDLCHHHPPEDSDERPRCGYLKEDGDPCLQVVSQEEPGSHCYQHPPEEGNIPESRGAPEGNSFAEGNPGGGPPEGNTNAMKHGLHMTAERLLEVMNERQQDEFKHRFLEYRDGTMNESQAMAMAAAAVLRIDILADMFEDGLERTVYTDQGDPYQQFKKEDLQALQGFFREIRLGLHYEGNSAQHTGGGGSGHDNLDALVRGD